MEKEGKHYRLELGFDFNEQGRNSQGNLILPHFLYDEQKQPEQEMHFVADDRLSIFLFDLTEGTSEHAVVCESGKPVKKKQALEYIFAPWNSADPPSLDNPFEGSRGKTIDQTEVLFCEPELTSSWTSTWWGPSSPTTPHGSPPESLLRVIWRLIRSCFPGGRHRSTGHGQPTEYLNIFLDETFTLTVGKKHAHDKYNFSIRLEIAGKIWSFDPQMIVDGDLDGPG